MHKELHIALQEAIRNLGTDVLKSPYLVNILQDYGAFDVHNIESSQIKCKLSELVSNGQIGEFLSWKHLPKEKQKRKWKKLLIKYDDNYAAKTIFESILFVLETPLCNQRTNIPTSKPVKNDVIKNVSNKRKYNKHHIGSQTTNARSNIIEKLFPWITTSNEPLAINCRECLSKIKTWTQSPKDYHRVFRVLLYVITVWNVIQLLSGIERVITWGVWNWGIFFDIIGVPLGIIGFIVGVLLPAFVVAYLCHVIETSKRINHKKTNILLAVLNLTGVYGLFVMSKSHYIISETYYSNYGEYTSHIDYTLWSWHHIWIILRPLVFLIGGIIAIALLSLILREIYKLLVYIGHALCRFFTS